MKYLYGVAYAVPALTCMAVAMYLLVKGEALSGALAGTLGIVLFFVMALGMAMMRQVDEVAVNRAKQEGFMAGYHQGVEDQRNKGKLRPDRIPGGFRAEGE